jgi:hypothetical protein
MRKGNLQMQVKIGLIIQWALNAITSVVKEKQRELKKRRVQLNGNTETESKVT